VRARVSPAVARKRKKSNEKRGPGVKARVPKSGDETFTEEPSVFQLSARAVSMCGVGA